MENRRKSMLDRVRRKDEALLLGRYPDFSNRLFYQTVAEGVLGPWKRATEVAGYDSGLPGDIRENCLREGKFWYGVAFQ